MVNSRRLQIQIATCQLYFERLRNFDRTVYLGCLQRELDSLQENNLHLTIDGKAVFGELAVKDSTLEPVHVPEQENEDDQTVDNIVVEKADETTLQNDSIKTRVGKADIVETPENVVDVDLADVTLDIDEPRRNKRKLEEGVGKFKFIDSVAAKKAKEKDDEDRLKNLKTAIDDNSFVLISQTNQQIAQASPMEQVEQQQQENVDVFQLQKFYNQYKFTEGNEKQLKALKLYLCWQAYLSQPKSMTRKEFLEPFQERKAIHDTLNYMMGIGSKLDLLKTQLKLGDDFWRIPQLLDINFSRTLARTIKSVCSN